MIYSSIAAKVNKNLANTKVGIKVGMAYKFEFIIGLVTTPISLFIYYFLWAAIYSFSGMDLIRGYTFEMLINYFVLNMLVGFFIWSDVDNWMERNIIDGDMIADLVRPLKYIKAQFYFEVGLKVMSFITQAVPLVIGAHLVLGIVFISWKLLILGLFSVFVASTMIFLISYIIGLTAFWFGRISGIRRMKRALILFLSGGILPIAFFPGWFIEISNYLPFQYIRYVPINTYLGKYAVAAAGFNNLFVVLGIQLVWLVLLFICAQLFWKVAFKRFAGAGA